MRAIRGERLRQGLKSRQLAQRMGVSPARVSVLEKDEERGGVTLAMLSRAAEALGCRLEYRLVPKTEKPRLKLQSDNEAGQYRVLEE